MASFVLTAALQSPCPLHLHTRASFEYPHNLFDASCLCFFQSSSDLPLLASLRDIATNLLYSYLPPEAPLPSPNSAASLTESARTRPSNFSIGFITPPFRDPRIPVTDHLHAHAFISPADQLGWFRRIAYSSLAWYDIDDLIAEIR
jgi:hypothetical protein